MVRTLSLLAGISFFLVGCTPNKQNVVGADYLSWTDTVMLDSEHQGVSICNNTDSEASFQLKLNNRFPLTIGEMAEEIRANTLRDSISLVKSAWRYVFENSYGFTPFSGDRWIHDPYILMNSLGGGYCDDRSSVLAFLWNELGFESRVIGLNGHVVSEVKEEGVWRLYDASDGVFFTNDSLDVVGVSRLEASGCKDLKTTGIDSVDKLLCNCESVRKPGRINFYESQSDNEDVTEWHLGGNLLSDQTFLLPQHTSLTFTESSFAGQSMAIVKMKKGATGTLRIPLVPYAIMGNGVCVVGGDSYFSTSDTIMRIPTNQLNDTIIIEKVEDSVFVYYHVNPKLLTLKEANVVQVMDANISLVVQPADVGAIVFDQRRKMEVLAGFAKHSHVNFLNSFPHLDIPQTMEEVKNMYVQFLVLDGRIESSERGVLTDKFDSDIDMVLEELKINEEKLLNQVVKQFPETLFWIFVILRYELIRQLQPLLSVDKDAHLETGL